MLEQTARLPCFLSDWLKNAAGLVQSLVTSVLSMNQGGWQGCEGNAHSVVRKWAAELKHGGER